MRRDLERAALQPALDLRPPVVAPEPLAVDDEERRAEDAVGDRVVADLAQPRLRRRRAPYRFGLAAEFGIDGDEAEAVWSSPAAKARLRQVCDDAVAHGVFGAPFFIVDGERFWGNDRRAQIERWLQGGSFQITAHGDL